MSSSLNATSLPVPTSTGCTVPTPDSLSNVDVISLSGDNQIREDFITLAKSGKCIYKMNGKQIERFFFLLILLSFIETS